MIYISPHTNKTYKIISNHDHGWFRYDIYDGDSKVQFALTEERIADSVTHYEEIYAPWTTSRFD